MPIYRYNALTQSGAKKSGSIFAQDYNCAYNMLVSKKHYPLHISKTFFVPYRVNLEDLLMFFMHVDFQLKCGIAIDQAIESFMEFYGNKVLNASLANILIAIKNGESISSAFEKCESIFDNVIVGLIKSAEKTGQVAEAIANILAFLKLQSEWKNKVKRAVTYPAFITVISIAVLILSITILGPQIVSLINTLDNKDIPLLTKFAINVLPQVGECAAFGLTVCFIGVILATLFKKGRSLLSDMVLSIPKIGHLILQITSWQFCKVLHISLSAKLNFIDGLKLAIESVKFKKTEFYKILDFITDGHKISESFAQTNVIPSNVVMAIYVGENGNNLESCFKHISENLYKELLFDIKTLGNILSAGLTLFTGVIFLFILCSLFYPIYNYVEIIGN